MDPDLKILEFFEKCDKPNIQHFYFAKMIKKGNFVLTTNFDYLIEYALLHSGVPKQEILPVITEEDFHNFSDPHLLTTQGKKPVYKIHGSTKNIIEDNTKTKQSLISTIRALGKKKEGVNIFRIEPFKKPLFNNIADSRILIVLGYSGSDDFDIVPTLKVLNKLYGVIWINHIEDDGNTELIYKIDEKELKSSPENDTVNQILVDIKNINDLKEVYRVDTNTARLIESLLEKSPKIQKNKFSESVLDFLINTFEIPNEIQKYHFSEIIYFKLEQYNDAMRCAKNIQLIAEEKGDELWKSLSLIIIGDVYRLKGEYNAALENYYQILENLEYFRDYNKLRLVLNNIGLVFRNQGKLNEALQWFNKALSIEESQKNFPEKATYLNNLAEIYYIQGKYNEAFNYYDKALKIDEDEGNLEGKAIILNNLALIYKNQANFPMALEYYKNSYRIQDNLENLSEKATTLNNLGEIHYEYQEYTKAFNNYSKAFKIADSIGDLAKKAKYLNNMGTIYKVQENSDKAMEHYKAALLIFENKDFDDLHGKANVWINIGEIFYDDEDFTTALKYDKKALEVFKEVGDLKGQSTCYHNIGQFFIDKGNFAKALENFLRACRIDKQRGDTLGIAKRLYKIGEINFRKRLFLEAVEKYEKALTYIIQIGLENTPFGKSIKDNIEHIKDSNKFDQEKKVKKEKKVGRNEQCPCGSGKKYKKCCGKLT